MPRLRFAGQITGCEGYVESAAIGLLAGRFAAAEVLGHTMSAPPETTALGALLNHITGGHILDAPSDSPEGSRPEGAGLDAPSDSPASIPAFAGRPEGADYVQPRSFQPMNINYGLLPDLPNAPTHDVDGKKFKGPERGRAKKQAMSRRALADLEVWLAKSQFLAAE